MPSQGRPFPTKRHNRKHRCSPRKLLFTLFILPFALLSLTGALAAQEQPTGNRASALTKAPGETWTFAVSADSRDCGDVVMPAIAAGVLANHAAFYWHLGDFRYGGYFDEDMTHQLRYMNQHHPMRFQEYESTNWNDFIERQLLPFGKTPIFLTIGNHELYFKTRQDYLIQFANWLNAPLIRDQRLKDNPTDFQPHTYYHWIVGGIDFFSLDSVSADQFDKQQVRWFESVLKRDESNPKIHTIVAGMHTPLPHSLAKHDMGEFPVGMESGTRIYKDLLDVRQKAHKHVYILNSHEHLYMADAYNSSYWRSHGGVLPGWTVGTAGAIRDNAPKDASESAVTKTRIYGYLLGTVNPPGAPEGTIQFQYQWVKESDVPQSVVSLFAPEPAFVNWCFENNYRGGKPVPPVPTEK